MSEKINEFYGRPKDHDTLIYQQLLVEGCFIQMLKLFDKIGDKSPISATDYFPPFVP